MPFEFRIRNLEFMKPFGELQNYIQSTLAKTKIIYPKNVRAKVAMNFTEQLKK